MEPDTIRDSNIDAYSTLHNVHFVDFDSPVSKIAPVSATGLHYIAL